MSLKGFGSDVDATRCVGSATAQLLFSQIFDILKLYLYSDTLHGSDDDDDCP